MMTSAKLRKDGGAALLMAIFFTLIINGVAMTLFVTSSNELSSSMSQVHSQDSFNIAEAGLNIGLLRIKAIIETMETTDPIDPSTPFSRPPFELAGEGIEGEDKLTIDDYRYFDLVTMEPLSDGFHGQIAGGYVDATTDTYTRPVDPFFTPEASNPDLMSGLSASGVTALYNQLLWTGNAGVLRAWRVFLVNDNDRDDKTALLVSIGYLLDPRNNVVFKKRVEAKVFIHGLDLGKDPDPTGQLTSSARGARTGRFRVTSDLDQPVRAYDIR